MIKYQGSVYCLLKSAILNFILIFKILIGGLNYLGILSFFSILFLLFHWYVNVLPYFTDLNDSINLTDSNVIICKLFNYLRNVCRVVFAVSTLSYSLERALAIFFPFQIIKHKSRVTAFLLVFIFLVSFTSPIHFILFYDLDANSHNMTSCSVAPSGQFQFEELTFFFNLYAIFLPIFIVILLNFSIVFKLKNYQVEITSDSGFNLASDILKMVNKLYEENFILKQQKRLANTEMISNLPSLMNLTNGMATIKNCRLFTSNCNNQLSANTSEWNAINRIKKSKDKILINQKFTNTKTLVLVSTVYIVLNVPNIFNLFILLNPYLNFRNDLKSKLFIDSKITSFMLIADIFNVANYSINGLLFFMFGKVFRLHLLRIWRKLMK